MNLLFIMGNTKTDLWLHVLIRLLKQRQNDDLYRERRLPPPDLTLWRTTGITPTRTA